MNLSFILFCEVVTNWKGKETGKGSSRHCQYGSTYVGEGALAIVLGSGKKLFGGFCYFRFRHFGFGIFVLLDII